jgi:hypothetical protein
MTFLSTATPMIGKDAPSVPNACPSNCITPESVPPSTTAAFHALAAGTKYSVEQGAQTLLALLVQP